MKKEFITLSLLLSVSQASIAQISITQDSGPLSTSEGMTILQTPATALLQAQNRELRRDIIQIAPNTYTAVGYDAANITMIVGDSGAVLIDAGKFAHNSAEVYKEFRKITDKPITGIIFTHGHGDHTQGLPAFLEHNSPEIWAAESFGQENEFPKAAGFVNPRGHRQNGMTLSPELRINNGVAPVVYPGGKFVGGAAQQAQAKAQYIPFDKGAITNFVSEPRQTISISGIELELIRTYGETNDHLVVWYPAQRVVFPGDQFYKSFPNLYAIRGTEYRDVRKWIEALEIILSFDADAMAQGHTRPVVGADNVKRELTDYRDAIAHVFNKTIEGMNLGMTPDELVEFVTLPEHLLRNPSLTEYYGRVEWAVRNIFNGYLGWFDGNATNLSPLSPKAEATKLIELAGGVRSVERAVKRALEGGEYQWAAELADRLIAADPSVREYKLLKAEAMEMLGHNTETATGRNYYYTTAQELRAE